MEKNKFRAVIQQSILVLCSTWTMVGCTGQMKLSKEHEGAATTAAPAPSTPSQDDSTSADKGQQQSVADLYSQVAKDISNPFKNATESFRQKAEQFHTMLLANSSDVATNEIFDNYLDVVFADCQGEEFNDCTNLQALKSTPRFSEILVRAAQKDPSPFQQVAILRLSFDVAPFLINPEATLLFAEKVASVLKGSPNPRSAYNSDLIRTVSLRMSALSAEQNVQYRDRISDIKENWVQLIETNGIMINKFAVERWGIKAQTAKDILAEFSKFLEQEQKLPSSFLKAFERVKTHAEKVNLDGQRWGWSTFSISDLKTKSDLAAAFMKIHDIYIGRDLSQNIEALLSLETTAFLQIAEWYIKIRLLDQSLESAKQMDDIFESYQKDGIPKDKFYFLVNRDIKSKVVPSWAIFVKGVKQLERGFNLRIEELNGPLKEKMLRMRTVFEEIPQTTVYLAAFPATVAFAYYAGKYDYSEKISGFFGTATIDAEFISAILLDGKIGPLFELISYYKYVREASEGAALVSLMAMKELGLFSIYRLDVRELTKQLSHNAFGKPLKKVQNGLIKLETLMQPTGDNYRYLSVCENLRNDRPVQIETTLKSFQKFTLLGAPGHLDNQPLAQSIELYWSDANPMYRTEQVSELVETLRSDITPKLNKVIFIEKLLNEDLSVPTQWAVDLRQKYLDLVRTNGAKFVKCQIELTKLEFELRHYVWQKEKEFLKRVDEEARVLESFKDRPPNEFRAKRREINMQLAASSGILEFGKVNPEFLKDYLETGGLVSNLEGNLLFRYRRTEKALRTRFYLSQHPKYGRLITWNVPLPINMKQYMTTTLSSTQFEQPTMMLETGNLHLSAWTDAGATSDSWSAWFNKAGPSEFISRIIHTLTNVEKFISELEVRELKDAPRIAEEHGKNLNFLVDVSREVLDFMRLSDQDVNFLKEDFQGKPNMIDLWYGLGLPFFRKTYSGDWGGVGDEIASALTSEFLGVSPEFVGYRTKDTNNARRSANSGGISPDGIGAQAEIKIEQMNPRAGLLGRAKKNFQMLKSLKNDLIVPLAREQMVEIDRLLVAPLAVGFALVDKLFEIMDERYAQGWNGGPIFVRLDDKVLTNPWFVDFRSQIIYDRQKFHEQTENHYLLQ